MKVINTKTSERHLEILFSDMNEEIICKKRYMYNLAINLRDCFKLSTIIANVTGKSRYEFIKRSF